MIQEVPQGRVDCYSEKATKIRSFAENMFGLPIAPEVYTLWQDIFVMGCYGDYILDSNASSEEKNEFRAKFLHILNDESTERNEPGMVMESVYNVRDGLNTFFPDRKQRYLSALGRLMEVGEGLKTEKDIKKYTFQRRLEGQLTAQLLLSVVEPTDDNTHQFSLWLNRLSRAANVFDSVMDLASDYQEDQTVIKPDIISRLSLIRYTVKDAAYVLSKSNFRTVGILVHSLKSTLKANA